MAKDRACFDWCVLDPRHTGYCSRTLRVGSDDPLDDVSTEHAANLEKHELDKVSNPQLTKEQLDSELWMRNLVAIPVSEANKRQVGGAHYGGGVIQHWDLAVMFKWNWAQYQITKYVMRYLDKNGLQDLEKAQHVLQKLIEEIEMGRMPEKNS